MDRRALGHQIAYEHQSDERNAADDDEQARKDIVEVTHAMNLHDLSAARISVDLGSERWPFFDVCVVR